MQYYRISHSLLYMVVCFKLMNERPVDTEGLLDASQGTGWLRLELCIKEGCWNKFCPSVFIRNM